MTAGAGARRTARTASAKMAGLRRSLAALAGSARVNCSVAADWMACFVCVSQWHLGVSGRKSEGQTDSFPPPPLSKEKKGFCFGETWRAGGGGRVS